MRRAAFLSTLGLALAAMVPAAPAAGQQVCELNHVDDCLVFVTAQVPSLGNLELGPEQPVIEVDAAALEFGLANADPGQTYTVQSNESWSLSLRGGNAEWDGPQGTSKPIGDLAWNLDGGSAYTPVSLTDVEIATGSPTASEPGTIFFQSSWDWDDLPGGYQATILLTFSAP